MRVHPTIEGLEERAHQIARMICSEQVPAEEIDAAVEALRVRCGEVLDDRPETFDRLFGRRFRRLRTRFQPVRGLFAGG